MLVYVVGGPLRMKNRLVWIDRTAKTETLPLPEKEDQIRRDLAR